MLNNINAYKLILKLENQFVGINIVQHFLTASILSIPAAIMYAEIMYPSNEITHQISDAKEENIYAGSMDAITKGTKDGHLLYLL